MRVESWRTWLQYVEHVTAARFEIAGKVNTREAKGKFGSGQGFDRWWAARATAVSQRVRSQLSDLVTEAIAYRQTMDIQRHWEQPLSSQYRLSESACCFFLVDFMRFVLSLG